MTFNELKIIYSTNFHNSFPKSFNLRSILRKAASFFKKRLTKMMKYDTYNPIMGRGKLIASNNLLNISES